MFQIRKMLAAIMFYINNKQSQPNLIQAKRFNHIKFKSKHANVANANIECL